MIFYSSPPKLSKKGTKELLHTPFFRFFLTKESCHLNRVSLMKKDNTQDTQKEKTISVTKPLSLHNAVGCGQLIPLGYDKGNIY